MGYTVDVICRTCKIDYYLGYGGSGASKTLNEKFKANHPAGHDLLLGSNEFSRVVKGNLYVDHPWYGDEDLYKEFTPMVEGYSEYKHVNLEGKQCLE